ncbi:MAG: hypothetical protein IJB53_03835 [Mailhella sp.]|nr:hypothetical protein [Mailhella sp.]
MRYLLRYWDVVLILALMVVLILLAGFIAALVATWVVSTFAAEHIGFAVGCAFSALLLFLFVRHLRV